MADQETLNFYRMISLIYDTGRRVLDEFFCKKLSDKNTNLQTFINDQKHLFYHCFKKDQCCVCRPRTNPRSTGLSPITGDQWNLLFETTGAHCRQKKRCLCQYRQRQSVRSSQFDISMLTSIILNSENFNINHIERSHVTRIRQHRNKLIAHSTEATIPNGTFAVAWDDLEVSIVHLANECSSAFSSETRTSIRNTREMWSLKDLQILYRLLITYIGDKQAMRENDKQRIRQEHYPSALAESMMRLEDKVNPGEADPSTQRSERNSFDQISIKATSHMDEIRKRLNTQEHRENIASDLDPTPIIDCLQSKRFFTIQERRGLLEIHSRRRRCDELLNKILSKDNTVILAFLEALFQHQTLIANYIMDYGYKGDLQLKLKWNIPPNFRSVCGFKLSMKIEIESEPNIQQEILRMLREDDAEMNELMKQFTKMKISDVNEGSIVIHLSPSSPEAIAHIHAAYMKGDLHSLVENILAKAGVLDKVKNDNITIVVTFTAVETAKEGGSSSDSAKRSFYDENRDYLVEELSPRPLSALLLDRGILNEDEVKTIFKPENQSRFLQASSLIEILNGKGSTTIHDFKQCLSLCCQDYISSHISFGDQDQASSENGQEEAQKHLGLDSSTGSGLFTDGAGNIASENQDTIKEQVQPLKWDHKGKGISSDEAFKRDEDWAVAFTEIQAIANSQLFPSIGFIQLTGENIKKYGTGFRVGTRYVMTTYHTFRDKIVTLQEKLCESIAEALYKNLNKEYILGIIKTNLRLEGSTGNDAKTISEYLLSHFRNSLPEIDFSELLNTLNAVCAPDIAQRAKVLLKEEWENAVSVTFQKLDDRDGLQSSRFDPHIPFADAENDIIILKLSFKGDNPKPVHLNLRMGEQRSEIHVAGYPKDAKHRLKTDLRCQVYTDAEILREDIGRAIEWWENKFPDESKVDFRQGYNECDPAFNVQNGRSVILASRSFTNGASGSPMFFIDDSNNVPVVTMMYQRGYPGFFYEANNPYVPPESNLQKYSNLHVPYKMLFAVGITMERVHHLLLHHNKQDLLNDIFEPSY